jgi:hypothetical protein
LKNVTTWLTRFLVALTAAVTALAGAAATAQAATPTAVRPMTTFSICANSPIPSGYVITMINAAAPSCDGFAQYTIRRRSAPAS